MGTKKENDLWMIKISGTKFQQLYPEWIITSIKNRTN